MGRGGLGSGAAVGGGCRALQRAGRDEYGGWGGRLGYLNN